MVSFRVLFPGVLDVHKKVILVFTLRFAIMFPGLKRLCLPTETLILRDLLFLLLISFCFGIGCTHLHKKINIFRQPFFVQFLWLLPWVITWGTQTSNITDK